MFGMVLHTTGTPLVFEELPDPVPGPGELRVRVEACGVCRTDLHVVDGELPTLVKALAQDLDATVGVVSGSGGVNVSLTHTSIISLSPTF